MFPRLTFSTYVLALKFSFPPSDTRKELVNHLWFTAVAYEDAELNEISIFDEAMHGRPPGQKEDTLRAAEVAVTLTAEVLLFPSLLECQDRLLDVSPKPYCNDP